MEKIDNKLKQNLRKNDIVRRDIQKVTRFLGYIQKYVLAHLRPLFSFEFLFVESYVYCLLSVHG